MAGLDQASIGAAVDVKAGGWREAVRAACRPLLEAGAIEERYVQRCIEIVEKEGPYVVMAPGIALAHARPEDGVKGLGLSGITLADPVPFDHPENDPVDLVFAFGSPDSKQHIGLLQSLARQLTAGLAHKLRRAETDDEARQLMEAVLEETVDG